MTPPAKKNRQPSPTKPLAAPSLREQILADFVTLRVPVTAEQLDGALTDAEQTGRSHLEFLQRTPGLNSVGTVTQFEVLLDDSADADALCRTIDERYRGGPVPTDTVASSRSVAVSITASTPLARAAYSRLPSGEKHRARTRWRWTPRPA